MKPLSISILPQGSIEQYARDYKRDEKLFVEEENKCKSQKKEAQRQVSEIKNEIKKLGVKRDPGYEPDYEPYVKPVCSTLGWIWGISTVLVFFFHCCIWVVKLLFDISWDTWAWTKTCFIYGLYAEIACFLGGTIVYGIAYWIWKSRKHAFIEWKAKREFLNNKLKETESQIGTLNRSIGNIIKNRQDILAYAYKLQLALPVRSIDADKFDQLHQLLFKTLDSRKAVNSISDPSKRLEALYSYYNSKLDLFNKISIPSESLTRTVLNIVKNAIDTSAGSRGILKLPEAEASYVAELAQDNSRYTSSSMDAKIDKFDELLEMNTSGFFTKHDSGALEKQVTGLANVLNSSVDFYKKYSRLTQKVNEALGIVRLVAYRNIYLGAELLNIVHEGAGGGKLTTAYDSIDEKITLMDSKHKMESFTTSEAISDILGSGLDSITATITCVLNDKKATKYAVNNPKAAAIAVAGEAAFAMINKGIEAWKKRNAKIEGMLKREEEIIQNMRTVVDTYLKNLSSTERALELMKAIIKVNEGFLTIYTPLSKKVFIDKSLASVSMTELQQLTLAIGEYKKISDSKL